MTVAIGAGPLALADVVAVARDRIPVPNDPGALARLERGRALVDRLARGGEAVYGVTTGVGKLKDTPIAPQERRRLQRNLVLSHAGGVGPPLSEAAPTRAVLFLLAASLARGHSGVRAAVVELVVGCLNRGVLPLVPERGSVGASGDLAPLAHVAMLLIGEGDAGHQRRAPARRGRPWPSRRSRRWPWRPRKAWRC